MSEAAVGGLKAAARPDGLAARLASFARSCVASPLNLVLTLFAAALIWAVVPPFISWAVLDAAWRGSGGADCPNKDAACWIFVWARFGQIVYGSYPAAERWRVDVAALIAVAGIALLAVPGIRRKQALGLSLAALYPPVAGALVLGGVLGLRPVATAAWGGLMLTLVIAASTITTALPLGLVLALGRRSQLPVIRTLSTVFIEVMRGLPLIPLLFLAVVMFPLFMPAGMEIDKLLRTLIAFTLFNGAIMAEVFRGGFQAVPPSQTEAAQSLGLSYWRTLWLVLLPQVLKVAIPGIVNTCIAIMKETTVVLIVGLVDFLAVIQAGAADPEWLIGDQVRLTGYLFVGLVFWGVCFGMSRYSRLLERRLSAGAR
jgi:general L-amino acid transport system permease protein